MRVAALCSLGEMRAEEAFEKVLAHLTDKDWAVRAAAIDALGKICDPRAFEPLLAAMEEEEIRLAEDCAEALEKITGQDFGRSVEAWKRWWEDNRETLLAGQKPKAPPKPEEPSKSDEGRYYHGIPVRSNRAIFIIDVSESMSYSNRAFTEKPKEGELSRLGLASQARQ